LPGSIRIGVAAIRKKRKMMENKTVQRTLYKVLRKTGVRRERISLDASFKDDLNFDQVDWTLFVYYLEGLFKIQIDDQEIRKLSLVNDTLEIVNSRTSVKCS
jgi:acyl carrier protein